MYRRGFVCQGRIQFSFEISCSKEAYFVLYFDAPSTMYSPNFTVEFIFYANHYIFDTNKILLYIFSTFYAGCIYMKRRMIGQVSNKHVLSLYINKKAILKICSNIYSVQKYHRFT